MSADTRITSSPQEQIERLREQLDSQTRQLERLTSSEEVFRHFFEKSPIMIYATDRDGVFVNINQSGVELMGFQSFEGFVFDIKNVRSWDGSDAEKSEIRSTKYETSTKFKFSNDKNKDSKNTE